MKTFESLFAELSDKTLGRPAQSKRVEERKQGSHLIGKGIVAEAGRTCLAAEHEGADRTAEEMSQLIFDSRCRFNWYHCAHRGASCLRRALVGIRFHPYSRLAYG